MALRVNHTELKRRAVAFRGNSERRPSAKLQANSEMVDVKDRLDGVTGDLRALEANTVTERDVIDALERLDPIWEELFPAEQARIVLQIVRGISALGGLIGVK